MDESGAVRRIERIGHLHCVTQRRGRGQRGFEQQRCEGVAVQQRHHQKTDPTLFADIEQRTDVRMRELRDAARLALESRQRVRRWRSVGVQNLDRHRSIEPAVAGAVDLAHSACADWRKNFVWSKLRAGGKAHELTGRA